eukprot:CAMPEP_0206233816 /NCGR_PEP_ID=MMETSP0047_2-20121206/12225_1 /ASSEMBLY_ACC=CAM_ASM_000192 /TAXON_ID=195065 /ORGANISM="Chroomonas mesostigmatica_cf, Strain CCMP1168" /LENGTH=193 /DNA_ID=CAMNT_0053657793 /DNA_START=61 /DNA_END=644 /DNA_ORIENTATION=+
MSGLNLATAQFGLSVRMFHMHEQTIGAYVQDDRGVMKNGEATFRGQSAEDEPEEEFRMVRNKPRKYKRRSDDFNRDSDDGNDTTRSLYTSPGRRGDWEKAQSSSSSALAPPQSSSPPKRATPDLLPAPRAVPRTHAPETGTPACKRPKTETTCEHGKAKKTAHNAGVPKSASTGGEGGSANNAGVLASVSTGS